ncbi:hypothetical protein B7982_05400 [Fibrobacter sp. UWB2]|uniref:hypothetical protein n=1 Tax=Fibrobacter sp. UWB2 TaxID=1964358 RepID=UPI000B521AC3|nr:hypothetical protein [Fibrobacter sp. UWB2]OWV23866.1 hypothetical protein B7982_05400 [Fibrobacter sp. UWB2]
MEEIEENGMATNANAKQTLVQNIELLKNQIANIDKRIADLQGTIPTIKEKYAPQAMNDNDLENLIAMNRAKRIKKDNTAQIQWNWQKNREDAERRFQQNLNNSNASQTRMKVNGAANDIRQKQISIANDFRQMTATIDPFQRKAYEDKILTDLDQMNLAYETLSKSYTPEQLASFGLSDLSDYTKKVKEAIKQGQFSADADFAKVVDIQTEYEKHLRSGDLTDEMKQSMLTQLEPLIQNNSKEAFALKQKILSGETEKETFERESKANARSRAIGAGNEKADANKMSLDELLSKWPLSKYEQIALEKKYSPTAQNDDATKYKSMGISEKKLWKARNSNKFNYLRNKGLI